VQGVTVAVPVFFPEHDFVEVTCTQHWARKKTGEKMNSANVVMAMVLTVLAFLMGNKFFFITIKICCLKQL
jgi:hypothetical protein